MTTLPLASFSSKIHGQKIMVSPVFLYGFNVRKIMVKDPLEIKGIELNTY